MIIIRLIKIVIIPAIIETILEVEGTVKEGTNIMVTQLKATK